MQPGDPRALLGMRRLWGLRAGKYHSVLVHWTFLSCKTIRKDTVNGEPAGRLSGDIRAMSLVGHLLTHT
jgi:hypothetical protein